MVNEYVTCFCQENANLPLNPLKTPSHITNRVTVNKHSIKRRLIVIQDDIALPVIPKYNSSKTLVTLRSGV
mgnify:CR=1 FL=1